MNDSIIIAIPCYNEEQRLDKQAFLTYVKTVDHVSFVFVNDGSRDKTGKILDGLCAENPDKLSVIHLDKNSGKAEAVRHGVLYAIDQKADCVGFWDADLATPLADIKAFHSTMTGTKSSLVMGARVALLGRGIDRKAFRHYVGRIIATIISWILGVTVYDTQCGAKLFRVNDSLNAVFASPFKTSWLFDVEILQRMKAQGAELREEVYERPLDAWHDVAGSKLGVGQLPKILSELWTLYRGK